MNTNIKEQVYDSRIHPLVEEMVAIAKEHEISLIFAADVGKDEMERLQIASTVLLYEGCHKVFVDAKNVIVDGYKTFPPPEEEILADDVDNVGDMW